MEGKERKKEEGGEMRGNKMGRGFTAPFASPRDGKIISKRESERTKGEDGERIFLLLLIMRLRARTQERRNDEER